MVCSINFDGRLLELTRDIAKILVESFVGSRCAVALIAAQIDIAQLHLKIKKTSAMVQALTFGAWCRLFSQ